MRRASPVLLVFFSFFATVGFAQNGGYLLINNDNVNGNSADIDIVSSSGGLTRLNTVSTGGTGLGGGFFAAPRNAVAQKLTCFWVSDAGSSDIASFQIPSLKKTGNFSNGALNGALYGIGIAQVGNFLISAWSGSANIAVLKINSDCTLTLVGAPLNQPDNVADVTALASGTGFVVSYPNAGGAQAYSVSSTGVLKPIGPELVFNNAVSSCSATGCFPTASDSTSDGTFWVWGNATLSSPSTLTAQLTKRGFTAAALQSYSTSGLTNIETPWFSPAGRAGNGNLYLGASGFGTGYPAGIVVATYNEGTISYASSAVNSAAFYAGGVQTIGSSGTGTPVTQIWSDSSANNTVQTYTVSGTTLTPAFSLQTTSTGSFAFSTTAICHAPDSSPLQGGSSGVSIPPPGKGGCPGIPQVK